MPEITDEELAALKESDKERKRLEAELDKARTPAQVKDVSSDLEALKRELADKIEALHADDVKEREAYRAQLEEVKADLAEAKKAQQEKDKVASSSGTMVIPPSDLGKQPPNPSDGNGEPPPTDPATERGLGKFLRKVGW